MLKITGITLQNFKSIAAAEVKDLASINVFFGPTNSGKTSFLESIFFQVNHQGFVEPRQYYEFLHEKADPKNATLRVITDWVIIESIATVNLRPRDVLRYATTITFGEGNPVVEEKLFINGTEEESADRRMAIMVMLRSSVKLSSSRRPGDSKKIYFSEEESREMRKQRFLKALDELELQGDQYHQFLTHIQKLFPHLVYDMSSKESILEFFGMGFLGTAKLLLYLFDARYSIVLIDEPEIHFYPSLVHRFVQSLYEAVDKLGKQIIMSTHSTLFLHERNLGNFYHITKTQHFHTNVRRVEQDNLLQGLDLMNAQPESVLQSDMVVYVEGPWDVGVMEEFLLKFPELDHANIVILQLGGGAMGNGNVDPNKLKEHNPLSFVMIDSERKSARDDPDPSHETFRRRCYEAHVFCLMLERQAIENYFTIGALKRAFSNRIPHTLTSIDPYRSIGKHTGMHWYEKSMDRQVARAMTREEIMAYPDIASFFNELLLVSKQKE